jgi:hypothetical protein
MFIKPPLQITKKASPQDWPDGERLFYPCTLISNNAVNDLLSGLDQEICLYVRDVLASLRLDLIDKGLESPASRFIIAFVPIFKGLHGSLQFGIKAVFKPLG